MPGEAALGPPRHVSKPPQLPRSRGASYHSQPRTFRLKTPLQIRLDCKDGRRSICLARLRLPGTYNGGRRSANLATPSQAWASWSASKSHFGGATICIPTGSPSGVKPAGTEIEGQAVTVIV